MYSKDGKVIVSCVMTDDTEKYGNCATCCYCRDWTNTRSIKEGDPGYCEHGDRFREREIKLHPCLEVEVTRQDIEDILIAGKEGMIVWGRMEPDLSPEEATERLFRNERVQFVSDEGKKFSMLLNVLLATINHFMEDPENHAVTINDEDQLALNMGVIDNDVAWMLIENSLDGGEAF